MSRRRTASVPFVAVAVAVTLAAALTGQAPAPAARVVPYPIDLPSGYVAAIAAGTRTETGRPGPAHWTNHAHYDLAAELDPVTAKVTGRATITYHNRSPDALGELRLHLRQNLHQAGQMRTRNVEVTDGVELGEIRIDGEVPQAPARQERGPGRGRARPPVSVRDTRLFLRLDEPLPPGGRTTLEIDWSFTVPTAGRAPRNGHEGEDVFFIAYWYPQFAVYDDVEGWVCDQYRGNGEFYMGYADYDVAFTAPVGYLVRMTGELQNPGEVLTKKAQNALQQAAESHDVVHVVDDRDLEQGHLTAKSPSGKLTWRYRAENVRDVAVSAARTYVWDATHAVIAGAGDAPASGKAMIHAVYEPGSGSWPGAAEAAQHTIEYMSRTVHPYPWPHMTACEGVIGGGMEFPMMTIIGRRGSAGTIAHELIHMWFPMLVGTNEKRYAWQDEGFTSFFTTLCRDAAAGRTQGSQRGVLGYVRSASRGFDAVCMTHADGYVLESAGFASYSKPEAILHQLRGMLGDQVFFAAFRRYAADWAFKHAYPYDFFRTFSDVAGQDLEPYFRTWFFETWTLDHAVGEVGRDATKTVVTVIDVGRAIHPATVEVDYGDDKKERKVVDAAQWRTAREARLEFGPGVVKVTIDPDIATLDVDRGNNVWER